MDSINSDLLDLPIKRPQTRAELETLRRLVIFLKPARDYEPKNLKGHIMTKDQELKNLDEFIATMPDTYIGDWLQEQREAIKNAMACDTMVYVENFNHRLLRAKSEARDIITRAELDAKKVIETAEAKAAKAAKKYDEITMNLFSLSRHIHHIAEEL